MRYVQDTSMHPYFTEHVSDMGETPYMPACACARGIGAYDGGGLKLVAIVGFLGLLLYGINRFSKGK